MQFPVDIENGIITVNGQKFYAEDEEYYIDSKIVKPFRLSMIPSGCRIILREKMPGTFNDYYLTSPAAIFINSETNGPIAELSISIVDENVERAFFEDFAKTEIQKGKANLKRFFDNGTVLDSEISVYEEIAYFTITVKLPNVTFGEAVEFLSHLESQFEFPTNDYLFLSYSSNDKDVAQSIYDALKQRGIQLWFDKYEIFVGDSLIDKVGTALESTTHLIVLLSKSSVDRPWVKKELNTILINKLSGKEIKILPVRLDDCRIPSFLKELKYVSISQGLESCVEQLINAIRH